MSFLLCAATPFEIQPTIDFLQERQAQGVDVLITGVGLTAATYALTKRIASNRPDFIVQAGVAGTLDLNLPLTKIVIVESEIIGDLGVMENGQFKSIADLNLLNPNQLPWKEGRLTNDLGHLKTSGLTAVHSVSVNEISTDPARINYYRSLGAQIESMEGAALHYVALQEGIRFLQIRSLSNFAGERDKSKWMMLPAIAQLNAELQYLLTKLLKL